MRHLGKSEFRRRNIGSSIDASYQPIRKRACPDAASRRLRVTPCSLPSHHDVEGFVEAENPCSATDALEWRVRQLERAERGVGGKGFRVERGEHLIGIQLAQQLARPHGVLGADAAPERKRALIADHNRRALWGRTIPVPYTPPKPETPASLSTSSPSLLGGADTRGPSTSIQPQERLVPRAAV